MSGHSKWSQIKRQKGVADTRRGQLFTKLGREISIAARQGGGDQASNFRLRLAMQKARDSNMPMENIERAIKRGTGAMETIQLNEFTLEGYGPQGVAILVQVMSDNRLRTIQDVRSTFSKNGGNLSESGSVAWVFDTKGVITVDASGELAEKIALLAIDAGAEDFRTEKGYMEIYTRPHDMEKVRHALEDQKIHIASAEVSMVPKATVVVDEKAALQNLKLLDKLDELEDVQHVYSNVDYSEEVLEKLDSQA